MKTTVTQMGDTFDSISRRLYCDEHFMHELIAANIKHRKTAIFQYGTVLNVPNINTEDVEYNINLPPWKR